MGPERPQLEPGDAHPIRISEQPGRVTVSVGSVVVADTAAALELAESAYPPVLYIPVEDVDGACLQPSDLRTYCPYKGEASYHHLVGPGGIVDNAAWYYPHPFPAVAAIEGRMAFYPDKVRIEIAA